MFFGPESNRGPSDSEIESSVKPHFLRFNEQASSLSVSAPAGIEEQRLLAIDGLTRGARRCPVSPFAWDCQTEPSRHGAGVNVSTPETFLIFPAQQTDDHEGG